MDGGARFQGGTRGQRLAEQSRQRHRNQKSRSLTDGAGTFVRTRCVSISGTRPVA
jgi:hypothetical protein